VGAFFQIKELDINESFIQRRDKRAMVVVELDLTIFHLQIAHKLDSHFFGGPKSGSKRVVPDMRHL
jgi:hypothetical protein